MWGFFSLLWTRSWSLGRVRAPSTRRGPCIRRGEASGGLAGTASPVLWTDEPEKWPGPSGKLLRGQAPAADTLIC